MKLGVRIGLKIKAKERNKVKEGRREKETGRLPKREEK